MRTTYLSKAILLGVLTCSGVTVHAATWLGNNASFGTATEWDTGLVPASAEDITINAGVATNTGNLTRNTLTGNATTTVSGTGTLAVNGRFISGGTINLSDNGTINVTGEYFLVGNTSRGTMNQSGGTVNATLARGFFLSDNGNGKGSTYNLTGGSLNVVNNGTGGDINLFAVHIGKGAVGDVFTIDGGTATFTSQVAARNVWISQSSTFQLLSGSASFSGYEGFTIGRNGTASGTSQLIVSGGSFEVENLISPFTLGNSDNGQVILTGGTMDIGNTILLGGTSAVSGTFSMSGGLLTATDIIAGTGLALFNFDGGEIFLKGDRTNILDETWFNEVAGTSAVYNPSTDQTHIAVVPEPSTLSLVALPLVLGFARRRRSNHWSASLNRACNQLHSPWRTAKTPPRRAVVPERFRRGETL
ncbi:PEP-CTERM sorting domain-containing protein [Verrucomicrobiota bacterium sgz303538]